MDWREKVQGTSEEEKMEMKIGTGVPLAYWIDISAFLQGLSRRSMISILAVVTSVAWMSVYYQFCVLCRAAIR